jgi:hypothetical protein
MKSKFCQYFALAQNVTVYYKPLYPRKNKNRRKIYLRLKICVYSVLAFALATVKILMPYSRRCSSPLPYSIFTFQAAFASSIVPIGVSCLLIFAYIITLKAPLVNTPCFFLNAIICRKM